MLRRQAISLVNIPNLTIGVTTSGSVLKQELCRKSEEYYLKNWQITVWTNIMEDAFAKWYKEYYG